jgi:hypothetical protein
MMICDPLGYPRWLNYNYGMEFANLPGRTLQFFEVYHTYRTIWTDGRPLPKDPGARTVIGRSGTAIRSLSTPPGTTMKLLATQGHQHLKK